MEIKENLLTEQVIRWVEGAIGGEAEVQAVQRLYGGITSLMTKVTVHMNKGKKEFVLRVIEDKDWFREPDLMRHEAQTLKLVSSAGLPAPDVVAYDETGEACGLPALLMTCLEGEVVIRPPDKQAWIKEMAETLVCVHAIEAEHFAWEYFTYCDPQALELPWWSDRKTEWQKFLEVVQGPRPVYKTRFIHRDYHMTNMLWREGKLSGIVDWINGCLGPAGVDIGHCRVNMALLHGVEETDALLEAFRKAAGDSFDYDPYWDFVSLAEWIVSEPEVYPGWTAHGATDLTNDMIKERMDLYMLSLLKRVR